MDWNLILSALVALSYISYAGFARNLLIMLFLPLLLVYYLI